MSTGMPLRTKLNTSKSYFVCTTMQPAGRVYGCDEQIGYVSVRDRRTYGGFNVRLRSSAMSLDQYRAQCALYADKSPVYVKDSSIFSASSPRPAPAQIVHVDDDVHGTY